MYFVNNKLNFLVCKIFKQSISSVCLHNTFALSTNFPLDWDPQLPLFSFCSVNRDKWLCLFSLVKGSGYHRAFIQMPTAKKMFQTDFLGPYVLKHLQEPSNTRAFSQSCGRNGKRRRVLRRTESTSSRSSFFFHFFSLLITGLHFLVLNTSEKNLRLPRWSVERKKDFIPTQNCPTWDNTEFLW